MRVSTSQIYDNGTFGIQQNQSDLFRLQSQLSTGRRMLTPQDDPVGASEALKITQSQAVNAQFLDNQSLATQSLNTVDATLGSLGEELASILEKVNEAASPALNAAQRGMIGQELQQRLNDIISLSNSKDGVGRYLFAGTNNLVQPFQATGTTSNFSLTNLYVTYQGNSTQVAVQANASQTINTTIDGQTLFLQVRNSSGNLTGRSLFDMVKNAVDMLNPSSGVPYTATTQAQAVSDLNDAINHVANIRAGVGANLKALESLTAFGQDQKLQYDQALSGLQDLDYTAAISSLTKTQVQLQAAQLSFKQISQLSLFSIL